MPAAPSHDTFTRLLNRTEPDLEELWRFVRLEWHRVTTGGSWFAAKPDIIRKAVRGFLAQGIPALPTHTTLPGQATV